MSDDGTTFRAFRGLKHTEVRFHLDAHRRGDRLYRDGWPDFLVQFADGTVAFVEIKSHRRDPLNDRQRSMFEGLEKTGVPCLVWTPDRPAAIPWRNHVRACGRTAPRLPRRLSANEIQRSYTLIRAAERYCLEIPSQDDDLALFWSRLAKSLKREMRSCVPARAVRELQALGMTDYIHDMPPALQHDVLTTYVATRATIEATRPKQPRELRIPRGLSADLVNLSEQRGMDPTQLLQELLTAAQPPAKRALEGPKTRLSVHCTEAGLDDAPDLTLDPGGAPPAEPER